MTYDDENLDPTEVTLENNPSDRDNHSITLPKLKPKTSFYDYESEIEDYEALEDVTSATNAARLALFRLTEEINQAERLAAQYKLAHDRAYRRYYLASGEVKPDSVRRMRAEMKCERFEDKLIVQEQSKSELSRMANSLRLELQALQGIGNNVRQQMRH